MPDIIIALISDYNHTFSNFDVHHLLDSRKDYFAILADQHGVVDYNKSSDKLHFHESYISCDFISSKLNHQVCLFIHYWSKETRRASYNWCKFYARKYMWEELQSNFDQDHDHDFIARRRAIWRQFIPKLDMPKLDDPMFELFNRAINTILKMVGDHLYKNPHTIVCPHNPY